MNDVSPKKAWILADDRVGHVNQSKGLAEALGVSYKIFFLKRRKFGKILGVFSPLWGIKGLPSGNDLAKIPDLVIATGNRTAPAVKWLKKRFPDIFTVQMMTPLNRFGVKMNPQHWAKYFDVVAVPAHEKIDLPENAIQTVGAPNLVQAKVLKEAKLKWQKALNVAGEKILAVLVGGSSKRFDFTDLDAAQLAEQILKFSEKHNMGVLVTTSRRTAKSQKAILKEKLKGEHVYFWDGEGDNPILGFFALADAFVVTAESTSMISEACSTGKPVYLYGVDDDLTCAGMCKFNTFYAVLAQQGRIAKLGAGILPEPKAPLADAADVAAFVTARFSSKR